MSTQCAGLRARRQGDSKRDTGGSTARVSTR